MKLLGLSGGLSQQTIVAIEKGLDFAYQYDDSISIESFNVGEYNIQYCDGRDPTKYEGDAKLIINKIMEADALLIGTPMYRGSYTGMLKNVFDIIPNDALQGKPVGLIATGGSDHHYLALEHELKPLLGFFYAIVIPGCVYASNEHYSNRDLVNKDVLERLDSLAKAIVDYEKILPRDRSGIVGPLAPTMYRKTSLNI